ncbi:hypothetical protein CSV79_11535 [Sporosarcina sp. P13]|uniref:hypothetical protein n=1 Tax=Sporosarcina sp. P13 TaxID=2048263 RepID=UPI000C1716EC|nr:hypothetical protein [Sporosarcina sp. P13]PIC63504.1 hypothetical protein CSV79_11535 [Sporosarcina sp. P13]
MYRKWLPISFFIAILLFTTVHPVSATTQNGENDRVESTHAKSIVQESHTLKLLPNLQLAMQWKPLRTINEPKKAWRIQFNHPMSGAEENLYKAKIIDEAGVEVSTVSSLYPEHLLLVPNTPYQPGKTYTLLLQKDLVSEQGITLGKDVYQQFVYEPPGIPEIDPPYHGTVFVDPNIITANDPSSFKKLSYVGKETRTMYDRRSASWIVAVPYLFRAEYYDGNTIEIQVNPEFKSIGQAESQALRFAGPIGQLPNYLREKVLTVWIHKGKEAFGGGNHNLLIHTEQADEYIGLGVLEEVLFHEATHTSIDPLYSNHLGWKAAQQADGNFISTYAKEFPEREDLAESFLMYYAYRQNPTRISEEMISTIRKTMPNRINFFDQQFFRRNK